MFQKEWLVLLVDDEPDVLSVSKLAMKNFTVYGLPIKIFTAASKAEALELLKTTFARQRPGTPVLAVALIDVVMETDQAGLELCQYIREEMQNRVTQLYVRTGQPGVAPERAVIDRYDINGYFTKVEATEDKLYSLVKSGVRQFYSLNFSEAVSQVTEAFIAASASRTRMTAIVNQIIGGIRVHPDGTPLESLELRVCIWVDGQLISRFGEAAAALARRDSLDKMTGVPVGAEGDKYVVERNDLLYKIAAGPATSEMHYLALGQMPPPDFIIRKYHGLLRSYAALWKRAQ